MVGQTQKFGGINEVYQASRTRANTTIFVEVDSSSTELSEGVWLREPQSHSEILTLPTSAPYSRMLPPHLSLKHSLKWTWYFTQMLFYTECFLKSSWNSELFVEQDTTSCISGADRLTTLCQQKMEGHFSCNLRLLHYTHLKNISRPFRPFLVRWDFPLKRLEICNMSRMPYQICSMGKQY